MSQEIPSHNGKGWAVAKIELTTKELGKVGYFCLFPVTNRVMPSEVLQQQWIFFPTLAAAADFLRLRKQTDVTTEGWEEFIEPKGFLKKLTSAEQELLKKRVLNK
jgi:hypothetical protein